MTDIYHLKFAITLLIVCVSATALAGQPGSDNSPAKVLEALFDAEWEWGLREDPLFASHLGDPRYNDRWPEVSLKSFERRHAHRQEVLKKLDAIVTQNLSDDDKLNYRIFRRQYENDVEEFPIQLHLI